MCLLFNWFAEGLSHPWCNRQASDPASPSPRFDPSRLQFMSLGEVPLAPEAAAVGLDIRVVGNDSVEKVGACAAPGGPLL